MTSPLISTEELAALLGDPSLRLLDASLPPVGDTAGRDPRREFETERLPGARFFDIEALSDPDSPLPHTLPSPAAFAAGVGLLGVSDRDRIVVYDSAGLFSAARAWWMLRVLGARDVRVLDGGLPKWLAESRPVDSGDAARPAFAVFSPIPAGARVASLAEVTEALGGPAQVVDARGAARFRGETPEPRPGLRSGHMPGALNLPYGELLQPDGTMKRGPALEAAFRDAGIDLDHPVVTTCGSGVTAAILSLGLAELGRHSRLYDGSWAEWGGHADTPVATG